MILMQNYKLDFSTVDNLKATAFAYALMNSHEDLCIFMVQNDYYDTSKLFFCSL